MKEKKNDNEKIDTTKAFFSVLFMVILILSSSYMFQSCDSSMIEPIDSRDGEKIISEYFDTDDGSSNTNESKEDADENDTTFNENEDNSENQDEELSYFLYNFEADIAKDNLSLMIENNDNEICPKHLEVFSFESERKSGWFILSGFKNSIRDGFCYYYINDNFLIFESMDGTFNATIDFSKCWIDSDKIYTKFSVEGTEFLCSIVNVV